MQGKPIDGAIQVMQRAPLNIESVKTGICVATCGSYTNTARDLEELRAEQEANARRITLCWNACVGLSENQVSAIPHLMTLLGDVCIMLCWNACVGLSENQVSAIPHLMTLLGDVCQDVLEYIGDQLCEDEALMVEKHLMMERLETVIEQMKQVSQDTPDFWKEFVESAHRFRSTPIVDNDYPDRRDDFDRRLMWAKRLLNV